MVLLHVKKSDEEQFFYEVPVAIPVPEATQQLVAIHNLRMRIKRLKLEGGELAQYGPAKRPDQQGIDEYAEQPVEQGEFYKADPTGRRTGNGEQPLHMAANVLQDQVAKKVVLTRKALLDAVDNIRGAVMMAFPQGLPEWDFVRQAIEGQEDLSGTSHADDDLDPERTTIWFAGKALVASKKLSDYLGRHEKTKAVVKLTRAGQGAPAREQPMDVEAQKNMVAFWHKKQAEEKALADNIEDDYTHSSWADPKALKQHFSGVGNIKIRKGSL
eukprot:jgi/Astpho2/3978/fgenesh1_pm.00063_%23_11_t